MAPRELHTDPEETPIPPSRRRATLLVILLAAWVAYGAIESLLWRKQLWGAHFIAYLPPAWWLAVPVALALMTPWAASLLPPPAVTDVRSTCSRLAPYLAAVVAAGLFWSLRERHLFWGDGLPLSINIPQGQTFHPDEPLSIYVHHLLYRLGGGAWSGATAVAMGSVLSGALFVGRAVQWFSRRFREPATAILAALCLLTQGFTQIFYGYVENYSYLAVSLLYFLTWGVDFVEGKVGPLRPLAASLLASALHIMGWLTIVPASLLVAIGLANRRRRAATALAVALVVAVGVLAVHLTAGLYGTDTPAIRLAGAAQRILSPKSAALELPSPRTFGDIWSQFVIVGPLSLPLVGAIFAVLRRPRFRNPMAGAFLCLAALLFSAPVFLIGGWGIGPARDWDIFAAPAVGTALCGIVLVAEGTEAARGRVLLVALAAASLFHTAPWIALNTSRERTMARVAELPLGKGRSQMMLGTYFLNAGDLDDAERWYRESLAADSLNVNSQSGLGLALARQGRHREALQSMRAAVRMRPTKKEFRRDLVALLFTLERWREASWDIEALLLLDPADRMAWLGLSDCYVHLGRPDSAALALELALTRLPEDAQVGDALAGVYETWVADRVLQGDSPGARAVFARLEARFPDDPRTIRLRSGLTSAGHGRR